MGAIVMVAANEGINHETGYGHEHEKKKALERHHIPLPPAYEICRRRTNSSEEAMEAPPPAHGRRQSY
jgi:hypothetical protein